MRTKAELLDDLRNAIAAGRISHSRQRTWCRVPIVYVYERCSESPSGVRLFEAYNVDEYPDLDSILRGPLSPLSPTERR